MMSWRKIDVKRKETLPPLSEAVCMYSKDDGYFVATVYTQPDACGRTMYYYRPDRYSLPHSKDTALRGKSVWWCALGDSWEWTRMLVMKKASLPPLDMPVLISYQKMGYFFGSVKAEPRRTKGFDYYIHAGRSVFAIKGKYVEWKQAPETPYGARY